MKPVEQTILAPPEGNCFAACIASILEWPLDLVPNFKGESWFEDYQRWLEPMNLTFQGLCYSPGEPGPPGYSMLGCRAPRGDWWHEVVCFNGKIVWDPHPGRDMGVGEWRDWIIFALLDPAKGLYSRPCSACGGKGRTELLDERCRLCDGTGMLRVSRPCDMCRGVGTFEGSHNRAFSCPNCWGSGLHLENRDR